MILRLLLLAVMLLPGTVPGQGIPFDPFYTYRGYVMEGRLQDMTANDRYLAYHREHEDGRHSVSVYTAQGWIAPKWQKYFASVGPEIYLNEDRVAFVAAETQPTSKSVGFHVFNAETGERLSYHRISIWGHTGRYVIGNQGDVIDMQDGTKIFGYSQAKRIRLEALIGDKILYMVSEGESTDEWFPILYLPSTRTELWRDKTFSAEVIEFFRKAIDSGLDIRLDGFPALLAERSKTRADRPFRFYFLKENGDGFFINKAFFGLQEPNRGAHLDFAFTRPYGGGRMLVAGINTEHLGSVDLYKELIAVFDANGNKLAQTEFSLRDNSLKSAWLDPSGNLVLCVQRYRPKSQDLILTFSLPSLSKREVEMDYLGAWNQGSLIDQDVFVWGTTRKYPAGTNKIPKGDSLWQTTVLSVKPGDGMITSFYPFDDSRYKLSHWSERMNRIYNQSYIFLPFHGAKNLFESVILPIPRDVKGWLDADLTVPSPVYTDSEVTLEYRPPLAVLSTDGGSIAGAEWHTPSTPGTYTITLSIGSVRKDYPVDVFAKPTNQPPIADFFLTEISAEDWNSWGTFGIYKRVGTRPDGASLLQPLCYDPDGTIVKYHWDYGDGTVEDIGARPGFHAFERAGIFEVILMVTDDKGLTTQAKKKVVVGNTLNIRNDLYGIPVALAGDSEAGYEVEVITGDKEGAGTNANVYLALFGYKNENGERSGSGEMHLSPSAVESGSDPFEQKQTDRFKYNAGSIRSLAKFRSLEDVEFITLRHDDSGDRAGWYVKSVRVKNQANNREWFFDINQWLAFDEAPLRRTWARYTPTEGSYACGIFFGGDVRSLGMTEASDNIFILPSGISSFYFTELDRTAGIQVFYSTGVALGSQYARGEGKATPPYIPRTEWGVRCDVSSITKPTQFKVKMTAADQSVKESVVWVFPSGWKGYEDEAKKAALVYPLQNLTQFFNYADTARQFLSDQYTFENMMTAALSHITSYGAQALAIFGDVPDSGLEAEMEDKISSYVLGALKIVAEKLVDKTLGTVIGELKSILGAMTKAREWAEQIETVTAQGAADAGALWLLDIIADCPSNFLQVVRIIDVCKVKMDALVSRIEANDPAGCRQTLNDIRMIAVGHNPTSQNTADYLIDYAAYGISDVNGSTVDNYCLSVLCALELNNIDGWENGSVHNCYPSNLAIQPSNATKIAETKAAMKTYRPIFENLVLISSLLINLSLLN